MKLKELKELLNTVKVDFMELKTYGGAENVNERQKSWEPHGSAKGNM